MREWNRRCKEMERLKDRLKRLLLSGMASASENKLREALDQLKENTRLDRLREQLERLREQTLANIRERLKRLMTNKINESQNQKKQAALNKLLENYLWR